MGSDIGDELAVLGLAVLWHDPPWKPWGITGDRVRGSGRSVPERILNALRDNRVFEEYRSLAGYSRDGIRSHEEQALVLAAAVVVELEEKGLSGLAGIVREASRIIAGHDEKHGIVEDADVLASALDRLLLQEALDGMHARDDGVRFVNPFNPGYKLDVNRVARNIGAEAIAGFIREYASALAVLADIVSCRKAACLLHLAYLLLEPVWYKTVGEHYVPPADTRIPTHTIFDHLDAALTTLLWAYEGGRDDPSGCLVVVDLAGVQSWIRESRRLRDLWASSWLASFLAWKTVEELVDKYGPGVMVQPPGRLHPFYTARHLGPALDRVSREGISSLEWLWKATGLRYKWPIDPVSPSRVIVSLPGAECREKGDYSGGLEDAVADAYRRAWKTILHEALDVARSVIEEQNRDAPGILDILEGLEPPLALRVYKVSIREAYRRAQELAGKRGLDPGRYAKLLFYPLALLSLLPAVEVRTRLVTPGRRAGLVYYELATRLYNARVNSKSDSGGMGRLELCTVCGRGIAVVNGEEIHRLEHGRLAGEIGRDRLCPYCLTKRLLRYMLTEVDNYREGACESGSSNRFAKKLTSICMRSEALDRLMHSTVDVYTVRSRLSVYKIHEMLTRLVDNIIREGLIEDGSMSVLELVLYGLPRNRFLPRRLHEELVRMVADSTGVPRDRADRLVDKLEALVLEALHDDTFWKDHKELVDSIVGRHEGVDRILDIIESHLKELDNVKRRRRKYTLLAMDGDYMGSGILRGNLGLTPKSYVEQIINVEHGHRGEVIENLAGIIDNIINILKSEDFRCRAKCEDDECTLTIPVTPSYHMTVSRALAALAQRDRMLIEDMGGMLIYTGGDDLLSVLPGAVLDGEEEPGRAQAGIRLPPLEAIVKARHQYWGEHGFISLGEDDITYTVVPALVAYGRSGAVYYVDSKRPLWIALDELSSLEDSKDNVRFEAVSGTAIKDALFIASDSGGAIVLPFRIPDRDGRLELYRPDKPLVTLVKMMWKSSNTRGFRGEPRISRSLVEDYYQYKDLVHRLARDMQDYQLLYDIVGEVFKRNLEDTGVDSKEKYASKLLLKCLIPSMQGAECFDNVHEARLEDFARIAGITVIVERSAPSMPMIKATGLVEPTGREGTAYTAPLVSVLLGAVRILYSSL